MRARLQKGIALLLACLMLAVSVVTPAYAAEETTRSNSSTYFRTSYGDENYLAFSISGDTLTIEGRLILDGFSGYMVYVGANKGWYTAAEGEVFSATLSLSGIETPAAMGFYTKQSHKAMYWSMIWDRIYITEGENGYEFMPSAVLDNNLAFHDEWLNPADFLSTDIPESVRAKSMEIVGDETDDYQKLFLLHRWVAENIYYDYDALRYGEKTSYAADDVLDSGRSVCAGYAGLLMQLIQAQGIACMQTTTYALGVNSNGGSFAVNEAEAAKTGSNHAHVEAFVDGRWVIMDPTWDSCNKYENGSYIKDDPNGYYYFDITPEAMAMDHKYISRGNNQIRLNRDGEIINSNTTENGKKPSAWAVDEVGTALRLIPYHLQGKYQQEITREEFCETVIQMLMVRSGAATPEALLEQRGLTMSRQLFNDTDNPYVCAANLLGIVNGTGQNLFSPNNLIARQEAATMLARVARVMGMETGNAPQTSFVDEGEIKSWARESVNFICNIKVMKGVSDNAFDPTGNLTRQQAYLTILRLYQADSEG